MSDIDEKQYMQRKVDLKPCPFCGGRPFEVVEGGALVIKCHFGAKDTSMAGCGAKIVRHLVSPGDWTSAVDNCRAAWNSRVELERFHETNDHLLVGITERDTQIEALEAVRTAAADVVLQAGHGRPSIGVATTSWKAMQNLVAALTKVGTLRTAVAAEICILCAHAADHEPDGGCTVRVQSGGGDCDRCGCRGAREG